jgi:hypothetical protein
MKRLLRRCAALVPLLPIILTSTPAFAESHDINPQADKILQSMSSYLGGLSAFSVRASVENEIITDAGQKLQLISNARLAIRASVENEIITDAGQKLQLISNARLAIERPAKLHFARKGPLADVETVSDGNRFTMYSKIPNLYIQREAPGTIDDAIRLVEFETGLPAPGADLMFADAYSILKPGITQATYVGTSVIDGIESHHLAFRGDQADWQLWVKTGAQPLPTRYVITSKWLMGAPQFSLRFHDWNIAERFSAGEFSFVAPAQARQVDIMPVDLLGSDAEDQQ